MATPPYLYDDVIVLYDSAVTYDGNNIEIESGTGNGVWAWYQGGA